MANTTEPDSPEIGPDIQAEIRTFMIADIRGYTRFTQERGDEAGARLAARFAAVTREVVATRGGRVIELRGDEALSVFSSARQAVRAAVDLQVRFAQEATAEPSQPIIVGIGLDAGEAISIEGGYRGGALNLAARLCSIAGPGEVLVSEGLVHLVRKIEGLAYVAKGEEQLKGLAEPIRAIAVVPDASGHTATPFPFAKPAPEYRFLLLGPCALYRKGVPVDTAAWPRPALVLLTLLATAPQWQCSRDQLMDLLWPDATPEAAASNLRTALHLLRRGLGGGTPSPVSFERGWVRLNRAYTWEVDLDRFEELVRAAADDTDRLEEALALYRGEALQEERYDDWARPIRDHAHQLWRDTGQRLARRLEELGEGERAVKQRERLLEDDPLHEETLRAVVRLLGSMGRRTEALRRYRSFEQRLRQEMDLEPEPETQALVSQLRTQSEQLAPRAENPGPTTLDATVGEQHAPRAIPHRGARSLRNFALGGAAAALLAIGGVIFALKLGASTQSRPLARLVATWAVGARPPSLLVAPAAVRVDNQGIVYVADSGADRIDAFSSHGRLLSSWGTPGRGPGQLRDPQGLALDGRGHVYVADTGNDRIEKFSTGGRFLASFGTRGTLPGQFRSPEGIAVGGPSGRIYVADTNNARVRAFTPAGVPVPGWDPKGTQRGNLSHPTNLTVIQDGRVAVADPAAGQVHVLESDGSFLGNWVVVPPPEFLTPVAVAGDFLGNAYILDAGLNTIREMGENGSVLRTLHGSFRSARGLALDMSGNLYVADTAHHRILKLGPVGNVLGSWGGESNGRRAAASPQALARDARGDLYVADSSGSQVVVLSPMGHIVKHLKGGGSASRLLKPSGVAVDAHGQVYVTDTGRNRIVKFSSSGAVEAVWLQLGLFPGPFDHPHGVRVDTHGHVYVADTLNCSVERLNSAGALLQVWYESEFCPAHSAFYGMAIDSRGYVYVTDIQNNLIVKFTPLGVVIAKFGGTGSQPGRLRTPEGVAIGTTGTIYVADTGNRRVDVFAPNGRLIGAITAGFSQPADVLVVKGIGATETLYVADSGKGRVDQFSVTS